MRALSTLLLLTVGSAALAEDDGRVSVLVRQLATAKDPRVRAQTAILLGRTGASAAVPSLCIVLRADPEPVVRAAAAGALGELSFPEAQACLAARSGETDPTVRALLERGRPAPSVRTGALYVRLDPVEEHTGNLPEALLALAEATAREKLETLHAVLAPAAEDAQQAAALVRDRGLRGYLLRLQLSREASERGMKVELLVMTYPDRSLKGSWAVKAAAGKPEQLVKLMVPRVLSDAAADLEWNP